MSIGGSINRNRSQQEQKTTYNADLEPSQQALASEAYGPNAMIGSYGMSGGQYPTAGKDPAGFGSGGYGYPGQYQGKGSNSQGYQGDASGKADWGPAGQAGRYATMGADPLSTALGAAGVSPGGNKNAYWGPGNTGQPGTGSLQYPNGPGVTQNALQGQGPLTYGGDVYAGGSSGARQIMGNVGFSGYQDLISNPSQEYAGMLANPGYDQGTQAAMRTSSDTASRAPFSLAMSAANRRAGVTGDTASVGATQAALAPGAAAAGADARRATDVGIAQEAERQREVALGATGQNRQFGITGVNSMFGTEGGMLENLLAQRAQLAALKQRQYTSGAGTGGNVSASYGMMGGSGGG